jgi:serine/threonine protein kinase
MFRIRGRTVGKYQILERVGRGGMSAIYKARDTTRNTVVAFKVLSAAMAADPTFEARFAREIEVLRRLDHPNIVPILDYGSLGGLIYIVMPYYPHGTLDDLLDRGLSTGQGARIIDQVASALAYAHEKGITHRDVKPSNILLDGDGNAVLSDFGFAHITDSSLSLTGSSLIGTPSYMSPEQCRGEKIDGASDQYSLAVVMYRMATGALPFEADSLMSVIYKHLNDPIPNPRDIHPNVPEDVEDVLLKALSKDPNHRYASVSALNESFQIALAPQKAALSAGAFRRQKQRKRFMRFRRRIGQSISRITRSPKLMRRFSVGLAAALVLVVPTAIYAIASIAGATTEPDISSIVDATLSAQQTQAGPNATALDPTVMAATIMANLTQTAIGGAETPTATQSPSPTLTAAPTDSWAPPIATDTPTPTDVPPTPTPAPTIHVYALTYKSSAAPNWDAEVKVYIKDSNDTFNISGARVDVTWSVSGSPVETYCVTGAAGWCAIHNDNLSSASTIMTVKTVTHEIYQWDNYKPNIKVEPK